MSDDRGSSPKAVAGLVVGARYRLESMLGEGGMAEVWKALHTETDRPVALKLVRRELCRDEAVRELFVREARVAARIGQNPHIVDVLDAGVDAALGAPFIAMELLVGEPLDARIRRDGPLGASVVADFVSQVADALDQAHAAGVIHRDLKPQNLFVAKSARAGTGERIKVVDFGIAKLVETVQQSSTHVGTPAYSAPEQLGPSWRTIAEQQGRVIAATVSAATDVWALGLCAYEMLIGSSSGALWGATTLAELPVKIVLEPAPVPSRRAGERARLLPPGFDAWLARCLELDAARRFPSADLAARAFAALVEAPERPQAPLAAAAPSQGVPAVPSWYPPSHERGQPTPATSGSAAPTPGAPTPGAPTHVSQRPPAPLSFAALPAHVASTPTAAPSAPIVGQAYAPTYPSATQASAYTTPADAHLAGWAAHRRALLGVPDPRLYAAWGALRFLPRVKNVFREARLSLADATVHLAEATVDESLRKATGEDRVVLALLSSPRLHYRVALRSRQTVGLADGVAKGLKLLDSLVSAVGEATLGDPQLERDFELAFPSVQEGALALPIALRSLLVNGRFRGMLELRQGGIALQRYDVERFEPAGLDRLLDTLARVYAVFTT